ncbi:probable aquaporin SIP2-1 [Aristolochia californica]|uniref:probable aquaporin SIP2-1 n=1 Tax=Aristolochia californica TaxID=171875 RepID=UPI0035DAF1D9
MGKLRLVATDFALSFMWVWSGTLTKLFVFKYFGYGSEPMGEVLRYSLQVLVLFFFVWVGKITKGGSFNPLPTLANAISGNFTGLLFAVGARIPSQVLGSIVGVSLLKQTFPEIGHGPRLNVDIHKGALTEGILAFVVGFVTLGLAWKDPNSFFIKTWISTMTKLTLHILGSDLTGGIMNPASAMGWAYARGDHITKEHLFVYWLAPLKATLLCAWIFKLIVPPQKLKQQQRLDDKKKSD